jgi:hypothetical protein
MVAVRALELTTGLSQRKRSGMWPGLLFFLREEKQEA